jgi:hypothetical protein
MTAGFPDRPSPVCGANAQTRRRTLRKEFRIREFRGRVNAEGKGWEQGAGSQEQGAGSREQVTGYRLRVSGEGVAGFRVRGQAPFSEQYSKLGDEVVVVAVEA